MIPFFSYGPRIRAAVKAPKRRLSKPPLAILSRTIKSLAGGKSLVFLPIWAKPMFYRDGLTACNTFGGI